MMDERELVEKSRTKLGHPTDGQLMAVLEEADTGDSARPGGDTAGAFPPPRASQPPPAEDTAPVTHPQGASTHLSEVTLASGDDK